MQCRNVPEMTKSSLNLNEELSKLSALIGIGSTPSPSNLYSEPLSDGIIRTHWPLLVNSRFCILDDIIADGFVGMLHFCSPPLSMSNAVTFPSSVDKYNKLYAFHAKIKINSWIENEMLFAFAVAQC